MNPGFVLTFRNFCISAWTHCAPTTLRRNIADEIARVSSAPFQDWFDGSRVQIDGVPLVLQHGTCAEIDLFEPFTHFGSVEASNVGWARSFRKLFGFLPDYSNTPHAFTHNSISRAPPYGHSYGCCYSVFLRIKNPLLVSDPGENHSFGTWANILRAADIMTRKEYDSLLAEGKQEWSALRMLLFRKGYDGVAYVNIIENAGSASVVPLRSDQVRFASDQVNVPFMRYSHDLTPSLCRAVGLRHAATPSLWVT